MLAPFPHACCDDPPGLWCSGFHEGGRDRNPVPVSGPGFPAHSRDDAGGGDDPEDATAGERRAMAACALVRAAYAAASGGSLQEGTCDPTGHVDAPDGWPSTLDDPETDSADFSGLLQYHLLARDMPYGPPSILYDGSVDESPLPVGRFSTLVRKEGDENEDWARRENRRGGGGGRRYYGEDEDEDEDGSNGGSDGDGCSGSEASGEGSVDRECMLTCRPPFTADEAFALIRARNPKKIGLARTSAELAPLLLGRGAFETRSFADVVAGLEQLAVGSADEAAQQPLCPQKRSAPGGAAAPIQRSALLRL